MGSLVMTLVSSAISIAKTVQSAKLASRGRSLQQQSARVDQGLNVPQPWTSIEQRLAHATYPYRVQDIKKSLNDNIIPLGYSLSLLSKWGFANEVSEYERRSENRIKDLQDRLSDMLIKLHDAVSPIITLKSPSLSPELVDKLHAQGYGTDNGVKAEKELAQLAKWSKDLKDNKLAVSDFDLIDSILQRDIRAFTNANAQALNVERQRAELGALVKQHDSDLATLYKQEALANLSSFK